ncbi:HlyD family secretion protein [Enhydrobacter aerosaccus]|uniref:Membrane fusion protein (MFP) family protein n=1 Tax=Enhydrobacter aerosaccus TaxID=225324 RepID=A0A1T4K8I9_9HYPH|nr:HlyD family type I secretion periplasmic adaptor subunit [Enhydrobacter aerosaccus]SJZ38760.1 HlyD family secretion protein [Enhydrobacter aerosaccus]
MTARQSIRRHLAGGVATVLLIVGGIGGWAAVTELAGAVIAPGQLVVDSSAKKVQHPTGGVVADLRVKDGDQVKAGDILVRLDDTQTRANLAVLTKALDELAARQARDEAERDGSDKVTFPAELVARQGDREIDKTMAGEQRLFEIRHAAREGQKAQLREQIAQLEQQIAGNVEQTTAKTKEIDWVQQELKGVNELWTKNLIPFSKVTTLQRDAARLLGERGALIATVAQAKGRIAEIQLKILQIDDDLRTEVGKDLSEIRAKKSELSEKRVAAEDQLKRVDLLAPQDGKVFQATVHTVGGVIQPGETVMLIVPNSDRLVIDAKLPPHNIDQVHLGQRATLRFPAFDQRTTPEIEGEVVRIGADVTQDDKKNESYYSVRITLSDDEVGRLGSVALIAGMPAEAFIGTGSRTALSYLVKPMRDQIARAFKER